MPRPTAALVALATLVAGVLLAGVSPATAAGRPTPGAFTGYAFDARCAPTQQQMDAWLTTSPFWGAGIYIGGSSMACAAEQPHLDARWVARQTSAGWKLLPIWVGPQASCTTYADRIDPDPASSYAAAGRQGAAEATAAVVRARALGIAAGSTLWYDLEDHDVGADDCRRSALRFLSGWTIRVRQLGYRSGVYSNVDAAIHSLDYADTVSRGSYVMPDQVWFAWANGRADAVVKPGKVRSTSWRGQRIHQYQLDTRATYGGVTLAIDRSFLEVGGGSVAPKERKACGGVRLDRTDYPALRPGRKGDVVRVAQCLLKQSKRYRGPLDGRYDKPVVTAVKKLQRARGTKATGRLDRRTWTALLATGSRPLLKEGSVGHDVRRLQRTLNVATAADVRVDGVLRASTTRWVRTWQLRTGQPATGVVTGATWAALARGRVGG
ncbi:glycoside hydrolase domain-containing protein [Nocardioides litoris]|uniref:glycoside hydrolase domain-containing protein n=1 Tax=Nocardioides litoris TaxID=1926648 RepID=UPI0011216547|nr:glycoside hydrolase domain-containing protein [Nocardioides litoris]